MQYYLLRTTLRYTMYRYGIFKKNENMAYLRTLLLLKELIRGFCRRVFEVVYILGYVTSINLSACKENNVSLVLPSVILGNFGQGKMDVIHGNCVPVNWCRSSRSPLAEKKPLTSFPRSEESWRLPVRAKCSKDLRRKPFLSVHQNILPAGSYTRNSDEAHGRS